ncbi:hypothetical protein KIH74_28330 [Kineosporia sp. J2-2]|uniref:Uncharacterized protein n=1 Tax=Kineosporia corallincola TaxID=2835133 RepID=A0ABS5TPY2_9ACTN|nr:hypothetical protein [Kineosporia corallincola]MBT0772883.1 hypothetical protein [Kineosporia corallincola]
MVVHHPGDQDRPHPLPARRPGPAPTALDVLRSGAGNAAVSRAVERSRRPRPGPAVQRVTREELHQNPPVPALTFQGPPPGTMEELENSVAALIGSLSEPVDLDAPTAQVVEPGGYPLRVTDRQFWLELVEEYTKVFGRAPGYRPGTAPELSFPDPAFVAELGNVSRFRRLSEMLKQIGRQRTDAMTRVEPDAERLSRADPANAPFWTWQENRDDELARNSTARRNQYDATGAAAANGQARTGYQSALAGASGSLGGLQALLNIRPGVVIGGAHGDGQVWGFLTRNLPELKASGVGTLYLENLRDDSHQAFVDEYLATGTMPPELRALLASPGMEGLRPLLDAARRAGVRVRGIGGHPARSKRVQGALHRRAVMLNTYAEQIITDDAAGRAGAGGYLVDIGASHIGEHRRLPHEAPVVVGNNPLADAFPGLDQLLGIPGVELADATDPTAPVRLLPDVVPRT